MLETIISQALAVFRGEFEICFTIGSGIVGKGVDAVFTWKKVAHRLFYFSAFESTFH